MLEFMREIQDVACFFGGFEGDFLKHMHQICGLVIFPHECFNQLHDLLEAVLFSTVPWLADAQDRRNQWLYVSTACRWLVEDEDRDQTQPTQPSASLVLVQGEVPEFLGTGR